MSKSKRLAAAILAIAAAASVAAGGASPTVTATQHGSVVDFAGCGYGAGRGVALSVEGQSYGFSTQADASGCFDTATPGDYLSGWTPPAPGEYEAYTAAKTGSGVGTYGHHRELAAVVFVVT